LFITNIINIRKHIFQMTNSKPRVTPKASQGSIPASSSHISTNFRYASYRTKEGNRKVCVLYKKH
jgi:hypothetical protein